MFWQLSGGGDAARCKFPIREESVPQSRTILRCLLRGRAQDSQPISLEFERLLTVYLAWVGSHAQLLATLDRTLADGPGGVHPYQSQSENPMGTNRETIPKSSP